jgi:hypothetical protein
VTSGVTEIGKETHGQPYNVRLPWRPPFCHECGAARWHLGSWADGRPAGEGRRQASVSGRQTPSRCRPSL